MIRILLILVALMSFSVMAQESKFGGEPVDIDQKIVNLICKPTTVTICTDECNTFDQAQIIRNGLKPASNTNVSVSETQGYNETYYAMDRGDGFGFQRAKFFNNIVALYQDDDDYEGTQFEGKYFVYTLNLLNSEYIYAVYDKKDDSKAQLTQRYECELAKSLFD